MDTGTFETWLHALPALTEAQRRQAFQALALSEAGEIDDVGADHAWRPDPAGIGRAAHAPASAETHGTPDVAALGQRRWTPLDARTALTRRWCAGERRVACHATAARPAPARSTP
jgi:hypothetical protein